MSKHFHKLQKCQKIFTNGKCQENKFSDSNINEPSCGSAEQEYFLTFQGFQSCLGHFLRFLLWPSRFWHFRLGINSLTFFYLIKSFLTFLGFEVWPLLVLPMSGLRVMFILKSNFEIRKNLEKKIREIEKELFSFQKNVSGQDIDTEKTLSFSIIRCWKTWNCILNHFWVRL